MNDLDVLERIGTDRIKVLQRNDESGYGAHVVRVLSNRSHVIVSSLPSLQQLYRADPFGYPFLASTSRSLIDSAGIALDRETGMQEVREKISVFRKKPTLKPEAEKLDSVLQSEQMVEDLRYLTLRTNPNMIHVLISDADFFRYYDRVLKNYGARDILFGLEDGKKSFIEFCPQPPYGRTILTLDGLEWLGLIKEDSPKIEQKVTRDTMEVYLKKVARDPIGVYLNRSYEMAKQIDVSGAIITNQKVLSDAKRLLLYGDLSKSPILSLEGELARVRRYLSEVNRILEAQNQEKEASGNGVAGI